jgi:hypothetical protein
MNEKLAVAAASAKNFVIRHKTKIAVTAAVVATATASIALNRSAIKQHDEFLKEHDLYDKFYAADLYPTEIEA